ncbi:FAD-dependent monooxygenase [Nonomuraea sp. NBC_00507]|uniref:FAD-dependent monooxygenase n=1 Tax=Nonomuraea sp. NBC_00507 TaxID=2976002 RepID=UPI002E186E58
MKTEQSIAIVGGSLTGPALALLLRQAGFEDVHVYEAMPEATPQAGGVIGLDHHSLGVLDTIGVPQEEIVPFPSERVVSIKVADGHEAGRVRTIYPGRNTSWTLAHQALADRLPTGTLHAGKRVVALDDNSGPIELQFADGDHVTADLVAFADGRRSTGRKLIDPSRALHYAGYVAWRGQTPWYPPGIRDFTRVEPAGTQFTMFPIMRPDGSIATDWTFYLDLPTEEFRDLIGAAPTARTFVLPHQITPEARRLVLNQAEHLLPPEDAHIVADSTTWMAAPIVDIDPPEKMVHRVGRAHAVLLGDALAPVRPHTARGANNGIEQAAGLVTALHQHRRYGADLAAALSGWEQRSLPGVEHWIRLGPKLGRALGLGMAQERQRA